MKKMSRLLAISYVGNVVFIFAYFFPRDASGASIYFVWLTLGHVLFWLGLPHKSDYVAWLRLLKKRIKKLYTST